MLVLSRKVDESVIIGDGIEVVIVQIQGDRVRLGFRAPDEMRIDREEVRRRREAKETNHVT
jgi:carbon storage regulator